MTLHEPRPLAHAIAIATATIGLHLERWGEGTPVVLVHGSLAFGAEEWAAQRPLADQGFELTVYNRRGYGHNDGADDEDFLADADDIDHLLGDGAHLVGHSYGGLGAMIAAARRPEAVLSLTLLEAPAIGFAFDNAEWSELIAGVAEVWRSDLDDRDWVIEFLRAVGSDPDDFPVEFLDAAVELVSVFRNGRPFHEAAIPYSHLADAEFPKLVVSGGHHVGFDTMCSDLAAFIGGTHIVIEGAGHEIQFTASRSTSGCSNCGARAIERSTAPAQARPRGRYP